MKKKIICLLVTLLMCAGITAMANDEVVYNADNNSVTISFDGYSTILIQSDKDGKTVMIILNF